MHGAELVGEVRERDIFKSSNGNICILKVHNGGKEARRNLEETAALLESECMRISMVAKYVNYVIKYKL